MSTYLDLEAKGVRLFRLHTVRPGRIPQWFELDLRHGKPSLVTTDESAGANRHARELRERFYQAHRPAPKPRPRRVACRAGNERDGLGGFAATGPTYPDRAYMADMEFEASRRYMGWGR